MTNKPIGHIGLTWTLASGQVQVSWSVLTRWSNRQTMFDFNTGKDDIDIGNE